MKIKILLVILMIKSAFAAIEKAQSYFRNGEIRDYSQLAQELVNDGFYYSAIPFVKEFLVSFRGDQINEVLERIIEHVGTKQFEVFDESILIKSNSPSIRYILAKKYFKNFKYNQALNLVRTNIPENSAIRPFALILRASIESITKQYAEAKLSYRLCIDSANSRISQAELSSKRQLEIVRDYCLVGLARTDFSSGSFESADLGYQDISKNSLIWPEILFEEAWNSFWRKDYNRTLGKLVTYRAPIFSTFFNPEIDVLNALTYLEMCLFEDAKKTVDNFYQFYEKEIGNIDKFLSVNRNNFKAYYFAAKDVQENKSKLNDFIFNLIKAIIRDPAYGELHESFFKGVGELRRINSIPESAFKYRLKEAVLNALALQRDMMGSFVRVSLLTYKGKINKAFESMSNIKLEVLGRLKQQAYSSLMENDRERGDVKYVERTSKQYFWTFNGEFWSDELGDYVFALKSECVQ